MSEREAIRPGGGAPSNTPLTPGIKAGGFIFVSGQTGRTVVNGQSVLGNGITEQTTFCMENIKRVLEAGGSSMGNVVKCTVYLTNIAEFQAMNDVYRQYFTAGGMDPPARTTVEVSSLANPSLIVEIEAVALA